MANPTFPPIRRIVTGHRPDSTAIVLIDAPAANRRRSNSGGQSTLIWCTDRTPADISIGENAEDMGARVHAMRAEYESGMTIQSNLIALSDIDGGAHDRFQNRQTRAQG